MRGVDLSSNTLYLITPLPSVNLELVDKLILGSVDIPPSFLMSRDEIAGPLPYVAQKTQSSLGHITKRSFMLYGKDNSVNP